MKLLKCILLICLSTTLISCGRQGPPRPPEDFAPARVANLRIAPDVGGLTLLWGAPKVTASGKVLENLSAFVVRRAEYSEEERVDYEEIATVNAEADPEAVYQYRDVGLIPGTRYVYFVEAVNSDEVAGPASDVLKVYFRGSSSIIER